MLTGQGFYELDKRNPPVVALEVRNHNLSTEGFFMPDSFDGPDGSHFITLEQLSERDRTFGIHKATASEVARLYGLDSLSGFEGFVSGKRMVLFEGFHQKILRCGGWLKFVATSEGIKLVDARFCKVPFCPMCQWRRALKWRAKFLELIPKVQEDYPNHRWLFLTLTIRNCYLSDLRTTITHLNASFNRLRSRSRFPLVGCVKSVEVTRAWDCYHKGNYLGCHGVKWISDWEIRNRMPLDMEPTNSVHPHLHICGLVAGSYFGAYYVKHEEWAEMWKECLRVDYAPIVNIKAVKPKKNTQLLPSPEEFASNPDSDINGMISSVCETLKYTVKEQDLIGSYCKDDDTNAEWLKLMTQQLYRTKRVEWRGILKEIGRQVDEACKDDDLINIKDEENTDDKTTGDELVFTWSNVLEKYILKEVEPDDES